jgi:hypothetical protein
MEPLFDDWTPIDTLAIMELVDSRAPGQGDMDDSLIWL